jgi:hypothetical protein
MTLVRRDAGGAALLPHVSAINRLLWRKVIAGVVFSTLALTANSIASAAPSDPTSGRSARDEAVRAIPWPRLAPYDRRVAQSVIKNVSMYRRLPTRVIDCDPDIFNFLFQHPEVVIDVWRLMGISQVTLEKLPGGNHSGGAAYRATDGAGTTGIVRFLFTNWGPEAQNVAVIFADGTYDGQPFASQLRAQSVLLLRTGAVQETNGRHYVTVRVDSFVKIEQMGVELIAKTVQPWISKTADRNFIETLSFVSNFSRTAEKNPQGMHRLAARLASVDEPTRSELVALCYRTAERYAQHTPASRAGGALLAHRDQLVDEY